jgi:hypothetical protein
MQYVCMWVCRSASLCVCVCVCVCACMCMRCVTVYTCVQKCVGKHMCMSIGVPVCCNHCQRNNAWFIVQQFWLIGPASKHHNSHPCVLHLRPHAYKTAVSLNLRVPRHHTMVLGPCTHEKQRVAHRHYLFCHGFSLAGNCLQNRSRAALGRTSPVWSLLCPCVPEPDASPACDGPDALLPSCASVRDADAACGSNTFKYIQGFSLPGC